MHRHQGLLRTVAVIVTLVVIGAGAWVITGHLPWSPQGSQRQLKSPPRDQSAREDNPSQAENSTDVCGPGSASKRYGLIKESQLPWTSGSPTALNDLQARFGARRLVTAFCTTLPNPILQEEYNIALAARRLRGAVVMPGEVFSLNGKAGPYGSNQGFKRGPSYQGGKIVPVIGGGVCKIASTLYNVATMAGMQIVERHPHGMPVPYVPPGRDATIVYGVNDFRFRNTDSHPVVIWAESRNGRLYMALYGTFATPSVKWEQIVLSRQSTKTVRQKNPDLPPGKERVVEEGADGITVHTWITIQRGSQPAVRRDLGVDSYRPMPRIIEYGPS